MPNCPVFLTHGSGLWMLLCIEVIISLVFIFCAILDPDNVASIATFNKKSVFAQSQKNKISGIKNTYFAGAYWRYGFHEDGVLSALDVCKNFGVEI